MDIQFLKNDQMQPWIWVRYFVDIFFIRTAGEKELGDFLERLNNFNPYLKFYRGNQSSGKYSNLRRFPMQT